MIAVWKAQFEQYWSEREPRERKTLTTGAVVAGVALFYLLAIDPAYTGRIALEKSIPVQRQQLAEINALSVQYNQLAPLLSQGVEPVTKEMIESALSTRGLKAQTLSINDGTVKLQIQSAAYANVMEWVAEMQKSFRLVVEDAKLTGLAETGQISVSFTMRQIRQGAN